MLLQNMALTIFAGGKPLELVGYSHGDTGGSSTTLTINKPAGVFAGDLLIAIMGQTGTGCTWTGDAGWAEKIDQGSRPNLRIATLIAGASEPSSYTFTQSSSRAASGIILRFTNAEWDAIGAIDTNSPIVAPSIAASGGILIGAFFIDGSGRSFTTPGGMTSVASFSAESASYHVFSETIGAGATGTRESTPSGAGSEAGVLFSVKNS